MIQPKQKLKRILALAESLAQMQNSAGIIDNATNDVLFRNPASLALFKKWRRQFKCEAPQNTSGSHDTQTTIEQIAQLKELTIPLQYCDNFIEKRYTLYFDKIGEILVVDKFYFFKYGRDGFRIWINQSWSYAFI